MVQGNGFWLNPKTNEFFQVARHESWIHDIENARKIGLDEACAERIAKMKPDLHEEEIRQAAIQGGLVRMRDYYNYLVAQFSASHDQMPAIFESICGMTKQAYPFADRIRLDNLLTQQKIAIGFHIFRDKVERGEEVGLRVE